ncbi:MAG TPA: AcvB/VirJ family lysyl-phosphatidylglycerol hydrolase [Bacteroidales bacterium]
MKKQQPLYNMKNLFLFLTLSLIVPKITMAIVNDTIRYGNFGKIIIFKPAATPEALVLYISGDGGWGGGPGNMATHLAAQGALVVGIDIRYYLGNLKKQHGKCYYPAGDFELLSLYLQKKYKFHNYLKPILMGYSSGATLAYGILAQAPANTFKGAISLGFCPDLETDKPLCAGNGLKMHILIAGKSWYLEPCDKLTAPFIVLLGLDDKVCPYKNIELYMKKVNNGELVPLPKVGHGLAVPKNFLPQLLNAYSKVKKSASYPEMVAARNELFKQQQAYEPVSDLPLNVLPAMKNDAMPLIFFISGDGGWTSFDEGVAEKLTEKGIPVIGLDAQKYFWQARTPDETASEIAKVLHQYLSAWNRKSFVLCGYSFGADIIPYLITRLPADLDYMLKSAVMMSPDPLADFEIHVADMLSLGSSNDKYNVLVELKKSTAKHVVCIFGEEENSDDSKLFKMAGAGIRLLPGTHHYDDDYNAISKEIINSFH